MLVGIAGSPKSVFLGLFAWILVGSAAAQTVTLSPTSLSFGNVVLGTASTTKGVTLKNGQTVALSITKIAASIADFAYTTNCPTTLVAGASCTISVSFRPASLGLRSGSLSITHNAASSPQTVALSGERCTTREPNVGQRQFWWTSHRYIEFSNYSYALE